MRASNRFDRVRVYILIPHPHLLREMDRRPDFSRHFRHGVSLPLHPHSTAHRPTALRRHSPPLRPAPPLRLLRSRTQFLQLADSRSLSRNCFPLVGLDVVSEGFNFSF